MELAADVTATTVATIGEYSDWPPGLTMLLSLGAGISVGQIGNCIVFKKDGIEIFRREITENVGSLADDTVDVSEYLDDAVSEGVDVSRQLDDVISEGVDVSRHLDDAVNGGVGAPPQINDVIEGGTPTFKYKEVKIFTADETNQWFIDNVKPEYKPPYKPGTIVKEIELTENTTFVRVYDNTPDGSGMYGSSAQMLVSEKNRHGELGKYMNSISHSIPLQNKKKVYFNAHIWGL